MTESVTAGKKQVIVLGEVVLCDLFGLRITSKHSHEQRHLTKFF